MKRILCGPRVVGEALVASSRSIQLVLVDESTRGGKSIAREAAKKNVALRGCSREDLDALSGDHHHQGVVAITGDFPYLDLEGLLHRVSSATEVPLLLALDQIQDVHNVGSLLRSSVALGADGIILCRHQAAKISTAAVRVSAGASEHAAVARVANMARTLEELRSRAFYIVGLDAKADQELADVDLCQPLVLVLGSEGSGVRRLVKRSCDVLASIPLEGPVTSLNVGVAGALALYEVIRQRRKKA